MLQIHILKSTFFMKKHDFFMKNRFFEKFQILFLFSSIVSLLSRNTIWGPSEAAKPLQGDPNSIKVKKIILKISKKSRIFEKHNFLIFQKKLIFAIFSKFSRLFFSPWWSWGRPGEVLRPQMVPKLYF